MQITRTSLISGIERTLEISVTEEQLQRWQAGELIQRAMPNLQPADREFIMTGITDSEWEYVDTIEDFDDEDDFEDIAVYPNLYGVLIGS